MLAAWRGSTMAVTRAKYRPALYDDERHRARAGARADAPRGAARLQRRGSRTGTQELRTLKRRRI